MSFTESVLSLICPFARTDAKVMLKKKKKKANWITTPFLVHGVGYTNGRVHTHTHTKCAHSLILCLPLNRNMCHGK